MAAAELMVETVAERLRAEETRACTLDALEALPGPIPRELALTAAPALVDVLASAETTKVLIWASLVANLVAMVLALAQRLLTVEECMEAWIAGMRSVTLGLMTLVFAWGVGAMSEELHVGAYMSRAVGSAVPAAALPTVVTLISALVSVASGLVTMMAAGTLC